MNKKGLAVLGSIVVCAALMLAYYARITTEREQDRAAANTMGVVNPESANPGLTTQPVPEISERTFKPAPSSITGSYTEPAARAGPKNKDSSEKDTGK